MKRTILNVGMTLYGEQPIPLESGSLTTEDGIIREILPRKAGEALYLEDAKEVSLLHMTLMLGMVGCRSHLRIDAALLKRLELLAWSNECQLALLTLKGFREGLMNGVTTARCMGDKFYIDVILEKLIEDKKVNSPRLLTAGIGTKGSHGAGHIGMSHCGTGEIRHTCRENLRKDADLLKFFITPGIPDPTSTFVPSSLSLEEISATANEGAHLGIPTAAHCIGGQGLKDCTDGEVGVTKHAYMTSEQGVECLAAFRCMADLTSSIFSDPSREESLSPANALRVRPNRSRVRENVTRITKARLPLVLRTDACHGLLYREVGYTVELEADPVTAVQGVTSRAARVCRLEDKIGKLENGMEADIITMEGNPLEDVSRLLQVGLVTRGGVVYR